MMFPGAGGRLTIGALTNLDAAEKVTVMTWLRPRLNGAIQAYFTRWGSLANTHQLFVSHNAAARLLCAIGDNANYRDCLASTTLTSGRWYKATAVYDGTQATEAERLKWYLAAADVDGTFAADAAEVVTFSGALASVPATLSTPAATTAYLGGSAENILHYAGGMHQVRVWIGTALTISQVQAETAEENVVTPSLWYSLGQTGLTNLGSVVGFSTTTEPAFASGVTYF
jgi:hypothetical protein